LTAAVAVADLVKRYGRGARAVEALRGVSLDVPAGAIYGLLGRNGAGKTTLVKILLDIVRPTAGTAALLGSPTGRAAARREVGYLPEDHRFPEYQTGESALHFHGLLAGVPRRERRRRVAALLDLVGLAAAGRRKVRAYSKGMKQRLGLAQAMVGEPRLLFLDEPSDGVDPVGRAEIRDVLVRLKQAGKTVFLNSHLLSEVERVCDRVGILERGQLVREGTLDHLTRSERIVAVSTRPLPDAALLDALRPLVASIAPLPDGFEVGLASEDGIDAVVDLLRGRGFGIRSLVPKRFSLEEVFLQTVRGEAS
jgi:ABC-2 type transport system ATP-binding protein